jgi:radical SAM enzyme (TIGR01210 family)
MQERDKNLGLSKDAIRKQKLGVVLKDIHAQIPKHPIDYTKVGDFEIRGGFIEGRKIKRLIIYLRSFGCEYMLKDDNGGCTMCGHLAGTSRGESIGADAFIKQFDTILAEVDLTNISMICIYNAGSFFNDIELPDIVRMHIYKKLTTINNIKSIIFESRPEYITSEKMKKMRAILPNKRIEIGIGLESSSEYIRSMCLNKGFKIDEFKKAIAILKENDIRLLAYVLQKPPFVSEKQAIDDTISSVKWAFENGVDVVSIEPVSVQKNTLVHLLYKMELYRSPWIWSVLLAIKGIGPIGLIRIGGFEFFPPPDVCTHNCSLCNDVCINAIEEFNISNNFEIINKTLEMDCQNCKDEWVNELNNTLTIEENIDVFLEHYSKDSLIELLRTDVRSYPNDLIRMGGCGLLNL